MSSINNCCNLVNYKHHILHEKYPPGDCRPNWLQENAKTVKLRSPNISISAFRRWYWVMRKHKKKISRIKQTQKQQSLALYQHMIGWWNLTTIDQRWQNIYLLYCWPSEGGNIDDKKHLAPVATKRHRLSIQGLGRKIINWFICHACTLACIWDCGQPRVRVHPGVLLAYLIHWNIAHGSAIVQHEWAHCFARAEVSCEDGQLLDTFPLGNCWWHRV